MKTIKLLVSIILVVVMIAALASCNGGAGTDDPDPEPETEAERVSGLMTSSMWKLSSLKVDDVSKNLFEDMTITFTATGFTTTKGAPVWPASGTWTFTNDGAKEFRRDDQTVVSIESITSTSMTLSLAWTKTTIGPGRTASVAGKHVFVFGK